MRGDYQQRPGTNTQRTTGLARHNPPFSQSSQQKKARDPKGSRESSLRAYRLVSSARQEAAFIGRLAQRRAPGEKRRTLSLAAPERRLHRKTLTKRRCTRLLHPRAPCAPQRRMRPCGATAQRNARTCNAPANAARPPPPRARRNRPSPRPRTLASADARAPREGRAGSAPLRGRAAAGTGWACSESAQRAPTRSDGRLHSRAPALAARSLPHFLRCSFFSHFGLCSFFFFFLARKSSSWQASR